ncbi:hypothetical protein ACH41H_31130 [Streptomyces sp. NPDC020800]|uniref:hypothetical protein n=1 Tax=Streptomyces sp. NPDC020800 TaxID=3365092 RepID=UPI0037B5619F
MYKKARVTLHNIFNDNTVDDPGDLLEICGSWDANRFSWDADLVEEVLLENHNLWSRTGDDPKFVTDGDAFIIESFVGIESFDGEFLEINGHVSERDDFGEIDAIGTFSKRWNINEIPNARRPGRGRSRRIRHRGRAGL